MGATVVIFSILSAFPSDLRVFEALRKTGGKALTHFIHRDGMPIHARDLYYQKSGLNEATANQGSTGRNNIGTFLGVGNINRTEHVEQNLKKNIAYSVLYTIGRLL
jgi:hypothetical protein